MTASGPFKLYNKYLSTVKNKQRLSVSSTPAGTLQTCAACFGPSQSSWSHALYIKRFVPVDVKKPGVFSELRFCEV